MAATKKNFDLIILIVTVLLTCLGIIMVYSSSSILTSKNPAIADEFYYLKRQGLFAAGGMAVLAGCMYFNYRWLRYVAVLGMAAGIALLAVVIVPGVGATTAGGATRWLALGGFHIQPVEAMKLALVVYMAHTLAKKKEKVKSFIMGLSPYLVSIGIPLLLLALQPDFGGAVTLVCLAASLLIVAGSPVRYLLTIAVPVTAAAAYMVASSPYRWERITAFLDPWASPADTGYQILQSWIAFCNGGLRGLGLAEGRQKLFYLPEAHTDFVFAIIGEELGFIGVVIVMSLFLVLILRGFRVASRTEDPFATYLAFGMTLLVGAQAFVNMAVSMGLLPTKGLALPFLSYGGSSLLINLAAVGILLNISSQLPEVSR